MDILELDKNIKNILLLSFGPILPHLNPFINFRILPRKEIREPKGIQKIKNSKCGINVLFVLHARPSIFRPGLEIPLAEHHLLHHVPTKVFPHRPHIYYHSCVGVSNTLIVDVMYEYLACHLGGGYSNHIGPPKVEASDFGVHLFHQIKHPPENRLVSKQLREASHYRPGHWARREWELLISFLFTEYPFA
nr:hypothetical protein Iba_chr04bCG8790 [Ipomoea batatas]GMC81952.1 hypothetical protein Iba_chr04bCG8800 [Ipomoea batatas]